MEHLFEADGNSGRLKTPEKRKMSSYLAFISYRHNERDTGVSAALRRELEGWHLPKNCTIPKRRRVFRDTEELPTSSDLGADIEKALEDSDYLIAVCSEDYLTSKWCMAEVESFIKQGRKDRIIPVLVSGTKETAVPEAISDLEPVDLREAFRLRRLFKAHVPVLLSRMSDTDEADFRLSENRFRTGRAAGIAAVAAAGIIGFATYAMQSAQKIAVLNTQIEQATVRTEKSAAEAVQERNAALLSQAGYLSNKAWEMITAGEYDEAIRLALSALPSDLHGDEPVSAEALSVLRTALNLTVRLSYRFERTLPVDVDILKYAQPSPYAGSIGVRTEDGPFLYDLKDGTLTDYSGLYGGNASPVFEETTLPLLEKAWEEGYRKYFAHENGTPLYYVFYDAKLPLYCSTSYSEGRYSFTLDGEDFYADSVDVFEKNFLAWLSEDTGKSGRMALFALNEPEALAEIELTGRPVSISWADATAGYDFRRVLIVDEEGDLLIYSWRNGEQTGKLAGDFVYVQSFYDTTSKIFTIDRDGTARLMDAVTYETIYEIKAPAPIRELWPCQGKGYLMAVCEDGVRMYDLNDGHFCFDLVTGERPETAVWDGWRRNGYGVKGNCIAVFFSDRTDIYLTDTKAGTDRTDYMALYQEDVDTGSIPFYSPDGSAVYLFGSTITKWDAETGKFLWQAEENGGLGWVMSADGASLWQLTHYRNGISKIDAQTGETLVTASVYGDKTSGNCLLPGLSPDESLGLEVSSIYGDVEQTIAVFDTEDGSILWQTKPENMITDGSAAPVFSGNGEKVYCVTNPLDSGTDNVARSVYLVSLDAADGQETGRLALPAEDTDSSICFIQDEDLTAVIRKTGDDSCLIRLISMETFETTAEIPFAESASPQILHPFTGGMTLYWMAENEDKDMAGFCCTLYKDGTMGSIYAADSPEGRRLWVRKEDHVEIYGEEAYITGKQIRRMSDDAVLLGGNEEGSGLPELTEENRTFAVSPDGSSVCIGHQGVVADSLPFLVFSSDADTLVEKAAARLAQTEAEDDRME